MARPSAVCTWLIVAIGAIAAWPRAAAADEIVQPPPEARIEFFERRIRPVLVERCYECHSAEAREIKGGLRLDTRESMIDGGDSGASIVPGDPDGSLLLSALRYESYEMPPDGRLSDAIIADFARWIADGAVDPRVASTSTAAPTAMAIATPAIDYTAAREFWSFQPPVMHAPPALRRSEWPIEPIDRFVLAGLEAANLEPSAAADRPMWIRRVTFDLVGLPPSPDEVAAFVADRSPQAHAAVVDRLLAAPQFGERWARMWLDVARYAEDQAHIVGNDTSLTYPNAYLYRDWVIAALNGDMPYDRFVVLQLAADLLDPDDTTNRAALGFIGLGPKYYRRSDLSVMADEWEDRVDTVGRGLLGLTVACARCHDHKFDPIGADDYYALAGVFASTRMFNAPLDGDVEARGGEARRPEDAVHIVRDDTPEDLTVFIRGNVEAPGPTVPRRFIRVLCAGEPERFSQGSGRLELAQAIASRDNPLTARVIVNRIWAEMFGQPLVATPSNFGHLGERPTHPELLDDLAVRFMESGWSLKWLVREMALSATYRQASHAEGAGVAADPQNRLLWRMNRRRLSVEAWRDAVLAVTARLDRAVGGRSIDPQDTAAVRRTVYSRVSRLRLDPMLATFDFPDPNTHAERRSLTTTPLQKLFVLNSAFMVAQADALAARLSTDADDDEARIARAYELLYARSPSKEEMRLGREFLELTSDERIEAWRQYAQVLLAANEFTMID